MYNYESLVKIAGIVTGLQGDNGIGLRKRMEELQVKKRVRVRRPQELSHSTTAFLQRRKKGRGRRSRKKKGNGLGRERLK